MRVPSRPLAVLAASGLVATGVAAALTRDAPAPRTQAVATVTRFGSCEDLLRYFRGHAEKLVGPYGLDGGRQTVWATSVDGRGTQRDVAAAAGPGGEGTTAGGGVALPSTQVNGVAEADVVALTGDRLVSVLDGVLRVTPLDAARRAAGPSAALRLDGMAAASVLVHGDHALVLGQSGAGTIEPMVDNGPSGSSDSSGSSGSAGSSGGDRSGDIPTARLAPPSASVRSGTRLVEVDLSGTRPRVVRMLDVQGNLVGARAVDGSVRIAVNDYAGDLPWVMPRGDDEASRDRAKAANLDLVRSAGLDAWMPSFQLSELDAGGGTVGTPKRGQLLDCGALAAPSAFAGLDTVSLVTADLGGGGLAQWDAAGVVASGTTVYATAGTTYVAAPVWDQATPGRARTQIHSFRTDSSLGAGGTRYLATGEVLGTLLSQWAMDEYQGDLRVASTVERLGSQSLAEDRADDGASAQTDTMLRPAAGRSDSRVTVLRRDGERLARVGLVQGLGRNESIHGVRFVGPIGYVVTFRRTDPLYTIDLRSPRSPKVAGELKLLGYSAYLHPAGEGLLLGIGQDADASGRTSGMQVNLFDVHDPAHPTRLAHTAVPGAWSEVEGDHHAFTYDAGLALAPFTRWAPLSSRPSAPDPAVLDPASPVAPAPADPDAAATAPDAGTASKQAPQWAEFDTGVLAVSVDGSRLSTDVLRPLGSGPTKLRMDVDNSTRLAVRAAPLRTVVTGGTIWTITPVGIAAHDRDSLRRFGFTRF